MPSATVIYSPSLPWLARSNDALYGQCLSCVTDLEGGMSSGRLAHAQALARMSITAKGTNAVNPNYGYDLTQHLNGRVNAADLSEASAELTTQFLTDDRTQDAQVAVQYLGGVLLVVATITDGEGPFPLTFSVSDAALQLLNTGN
jgi:hypothetical protein